MEKLDRFPTVVGVPRETEAVGEFLGWVGPGLPLLPSPWQMMVNVPLFAGNPQLQEQLRLQLPVFLQQVSKESRGAEVEGKGWTAKPNRWKLREGAEPLDSGLRLPLVSCHLPLPFSACLPPDAEPRVTLHPYKSPRHAGAAADPAGTADLADRGPWAGTQVRTGDRWATRSWPLLPFSLQPLLPFSEQPLWL